MNKLFTQAFKHKIKTIGLIIALVAFGTGISCILSYSTSAGLIALGLPFLIGMAKVKYGAMVTDARGSIDGVVYSKNQYGGYVRVKVSPVQPRTASQQATRSSLGQLSKEYSNLLTDAQRTNWKTFAESNPVVDVFGNSQTLNAISMYQRINRVLHNLGLPSIQDVPLNMNVTALLTAVPVADESLGTISIDFTNTPLDADSHIYVFATGPLNGGVNYIEKDLQFLTSSPAAQASPLDVASEWEAKYGAMVVGQRIGFEIMTVNEINGAVSVGLRSIITVIA